MVIYGTQGLAYNRVCFGGREKSRLNEMRNS